MTADSADPSRPVPDDPIPDDKDWTWVLGAVCPECGYDASTVDRESIAARLLASTPRWQAELARADVAERPQPQVWSVLEYACHIRDVHAVFGERARLIQQRDDPEFANWDQDVTALDRRYWEANPVQVAAELEAEGSSAAASFFGLSDAGWSRTGRRSNGSVFTMQTLGLYYLHDVEHHLNDVQP